MRQALAALAALFLLSAADPAAAQEAPAGAPKSCTVIQPVVNVAIRHDPIRHDFGRDYDRLTSSQNNLKSGEYVMGLYRAQLGYSMTFKYHVEPRPGHTGCVSVREINLEMGMRNRSIYLAREIAQGTCAQREVLKHEQGHAAIDEAMVRKAAGEMKRYIERSLASYTPIETWQPELASEAIEAKMQHAMSVAVNRIEERRQGLQRSFDSPEEYARLAKVCNGQLQKFIEPRDAGAAHRH